MKEPEVVEASCQEVDVSTYRFRSASTSDFSTLIERPTLVRDRITGLISVVYLELDEDCRDLVSRLHSIKYEEHERTNGMKTRSRVFGYRPRIPIRHDYCSASSLLYDEQETHQMILSYAQKVSTYYERYDPELYHYHEREVEKILPAWRFEKSVFTSGIINKNNALSYHFDSGNFKQVWSNMLVFRDGTEGGILSLPEYDLGIAVKNNSLVMFDGQNLLHGVTPIVKIHPDGYRYSLVYYSLQQMWQCLDPKKEMTRIRERRTEREKNSAQRGPLNGSSSSK